MAGCPFGGIPPWALRDKETGRMPRMLVEPHRVRDGLDTGCVGATMEDGTVYRANRRGHIEVENVDHARAMVKNPLAPGHVLEAKFHGGGTPGVSCGGCGFGGFHFQASRPCPRCGEQCWDSTYQEAAS